MLGEKGVEFWVFSLFIEVLLIAKNKSQISLKNKQKNVGEKSFKKRKEKTLIRIELDFQI